MTESKDLDLHIAMPLLFFGMAALIGTINFLYFAFGYEVVLDSRYAVLEYQNRLMGCLIAAMSTCTSVLCITLVGLFSKKGG